MRLTDARLRRWRDKLAKLENESYALEQEVGSVKLNAKGGRYSKSAELHKYVKEAQRAISLAQSARLALHASETTKQL